MSKDDIQEIIYICNSHCGSVEGLGYVDEDSVWEEIKERGLINE